MSEKSAQSVQPRVQSPDTSQVLYFKSANKDAFFRPPSSQQAVNIRRYMQGILHAESFSSNDASTQVHDNGSFRRVAYGSSKPSFGTGEHLGCFLDMSAKWRHPRTMSGCSRANLGLLSRRPGNILVCKRAGKAKRGLVERMQTLNGFRSFHVS